MEDKKICLLGVSGNLYTKMIILALDKLNVSYDIILVRKGGGFRSFNSIHTLVNKVRGLFGALNKFYPPSGLTYWKGILKYLKYIKSAEYKKLMNKYDSVDFSTLLEGKKVKYFKDENHVDLYYYLKAQQYEWGVLGGVGIISSRIIDCFQGYLINAHPAKLPECGGSGAYLYSLYYDLPPTASVHKVLTKVDKGDIIDTQEIEMSKSDNLFSLNIKLSIRRAKMLAEILQELSIGKEVNAIPNNGKNHIWKNFTFEQFKVAESNLKKRLAKAKA